MNATLTSLLPANETERLETLRQYDILHSLQEAVFNEFVGLTARIFNLPISLITLVDSEEVEYKANEGLPGLRSQPRAEVLCALVVRDHKAIVINDMDTENGLAVEAILVAQDQNLRFYAGAPLVMLDHFSVGTLCVIDRRPRTFSAAEQQVLEHLA
nr:putative LOV domain-containing protein [Tanacetum cinerariifolium]